jgi:HEAT repeat protein
MKESGEVSSHEVVNLVKALSGANKEERMNAVKKLVEAHHNWVNYADKDTVDSLVKDLRDENAINRDRVRKLLAAVDKKAVPALLRGLKSKDHIIKEESVKVLKLIKDPETVDALIAALEDDLFDVRWLAGEALISFGDRALEPMFYNLIKRPESRAIREGIHRVLHGIYRTRNRDLVKPVIMAMESTESHLGVPIAAQEALASLKTAGKVSG